MSQTTERYADAHNLAVTGLYAGKGSGSVWNPEKVLTCLRNLARWQSVRALLNKRTKLWCPMCSTLQPVTDYRPLATLAVLSCRHTRQTHTVTDSEYADLVERAKGLKVTGNARVGGHDRLEAV